MVKFPMDRPVKIVMLGAGGTGGYVAPYLFRLLHMLDRPARFVICDGDIVELKDLDRQILSRRISEKTKPVFWQNAIPQSLVWKQNTSPISSRRSRS